LTGVLIGHGQAVATVRASVRNRHGSFLEFKRNPVVRRASTCVF